MSIYSAKRGFTLIELLVVIAIIAILAAILFPVFTQAKRAAKSIVTTSNMKQLGTAFQMYSGDWDDRTVLHERPNTAPVTDPEIYWIQRLWPYTKSQDIAWDATTGQPSLDRPTTGVAWDWAVYTNLSANGPGLLGYWSWPNNVATFNYSRVLGAQENISQRAAFVTTTWPGYGDPWGWYQFINYSAIAPNYADPNDFWANQVYGARVRHADSVVVSYADGHAGKTPIKKQVIPQGGAFWDYYKGERQAFWGAYWNETE